MKARSNINVRSVTNLVADCDSLVQSGMTLSGVDI